MKTFQVVFPFLSHCLSVASLNVGKPDLVCVESLKI